MLILKSVSEEFEPVYATSHSAGADVKAREEVVIAPGETVVIPTGVYIDRWLPEFIDDKIFIPYLDIRLRSSLSLQGLSIPNGVGTIDVDYGEEIGIILYNNNEDHLIIKKGTRVGQLVLQHTMNITGARRLDTMRVGGYGSTNVSPSGGAAHDKKGE